MNQLGSGSVNQMQACRVWALVGQEERCEVCVQGHFASM